MYVSGALPGSALSRRRWVESTRVRVVASPGLHEEAGRPLTTFDAKDPTGSQMIDDQEPKGLDAWRKPSALWLIPAAIIAFIVLLLAGRRARRNRQ